jgi:hypothetical protein
VAEQWNNGNLLVAFLKLTSGGKQQTAAIPTAYYISINLKLFCFIVLAIM